MKRWILGFYRGSPKISGIQEIDWKPLENPLKFSSEYNPFETIIKIPQCHKTFYAKNYKLFK
jgi:hypothetical protein